MDDPVENTPGADGPLLDPAAFVRLREWGGDELLRKMIELFIQNTPDRLDQIRSGIASDDADAVERGAHSLKSSCANLGAEAVRTLAARIEELAEVGDIESAGTLLPQLETRYDRTLAALVRARDRGTANGGTPE